MLRRANAGVPSTSEVDVAGVEIRGASNRHPEGGGVFVPCVSLENASQEAPSMAGLIFDNLEMGTW